MIDWSKLKPYEYDQYRSFEELCYQVATGLYGDRGRFTSIDDSGGGDGVEFYLTFPNRDQWGWQAKFYYPDGRLSVSGRKASIKASLQTACEKHPRLLKWFLCTPRNLTPDEQVWFEDKLVETRNAGRPTVPKDHPVKLENWGESDFLSWMSSPQFSGKRLFFFGELELDLDWFRSRFDRAVAAIGDRFNPTLHTETDVDTAIHALLSDEDIAPRIEVLLGQAQNLFDRYQEAVSDLEISIPHQVDWNKTKVNLIPAAAALQSVLQMALSALRHAYDLLVSHEFSELRRWDWSQTLEQAKSTLKEYGQEEEGFNVSQVRFTGKDGNLKQSTLHEAEQIVHLPARFAARLMDDLVAIREWFSGVHQSELRILGDAGVGKTHIASHICNSRLKQNLPALLLLGSQFTSNQPLTDQLKAILDVPATYSWSDFLKAVEAAAKAYRTRIPLIIDGLDGAIYNGAYTRVWELGLAALSHEIAQATDVVLITTCRTTYEQSTWPSFAPENTAYLYGFDASQTETAVERYFEWYKIKADLTTAPLSQFKHPIYLKIFCESTNRERETEKTVYVGQQSLFAVFDAYLKQCNKSICKRLGLYPRTNIVGASLRGVAFHLWDQRARTIGLAQLVELIDGEPVDRLKWETSKTKGLLDEGLLLHIERQDDEDVVLFTYKLLGGYLIAQNLLEQFKYELAVFLQSDTTQAALFSGDFRGLHPIHDDIGRCLAALLPMRTGRYLHELARGERPFILSVNALFEIAPVYVTQEAVTMVARLFDHPKKRKHLLQLAATTVGHSEHPLNSSFWSEQLKRLWMPDRDTAWTEYVRESREHLEKAITQFETVCQSTVPVSEAAAERYQLLAEHVIWVLTSTVRPLRDQATRALYWYGRRFPDRFLNLVLKSLEINDPYVPERMLAAAYGVAMARQYDFANPTFAEEMLPQYGRALYEAMFRPSAPHSTTHILARDYARYTIEIALNHHPGLLSLDEQVRIRSPFTDGGIREWREREDENSNDYSGGSSPIHLDFGNYTLGRLLDDRRNYDFDHEEYKQIRANVLWRICDLGYSAEAFDVIDREIARWSRHYSQLGDRQKTERYGKKYSWIAFYELAGYRSDLGLLPEDPAIERISDTDIDPSFPLVCQEHDLVRMDFLGDPDVSTREWIAVGGAPDLDPYFIVQELMGEQGPWVLLDGHINQENTAAKRNLFVFPRGFIAGQEAVAEIAQHLEKQSHPRDWLPEIPGDHYTYAGEIPWCATYPYNGNNKLSLVVETRCETHLAEKPVFYRNNEPLSEKEENEFWRANPDPLGRLFILAKLRSNGAPDEVLGSRLKDAGLEVRLCLVPEEREVKEYQEHEVLVPVRSNNWEDYHSSLNPGRSVLTPAKEITEHLSLCGRPQTFDLYEKSGKRASVTFCHGNPWRTYQALTYLRQDLLERYLAETGTELVWVIWGERRILTAATDGPEIAPDLYHGLGKFRYARVYGKLK